MFLPIEFSALAIFHVLTHFAKQNIKYIPKHAPKIARPGIHKYPSDRSKYLPVCLNSNAAMIMHITQETAPPNLDRCFSIFIGSLNRVPSEKNSIASIVELLQF